MGMRMKWRYVLFGGKWTGRVQNEIDVGEFKLRVYRVGKTWQWSIEFPQRFGYARGRIEAQWHASTEFRRILETTLNELNMIDDDRV